jgi:hypothetical protein
MKGKWKRGLAIVFAIALVTSAGVFSTDHFLKATDGEENILDFSESGEEALAVEEELELPAEEETVVTIEQGVFESDLTDENIAQENVEESIAEEPEAEAVNSENMAAEVSAEAESKPLATEEKAEPTTAAAENSAELTTAAAENSAKPATAAESSAEPTAVAAENSVKPAAAAENKTVPAETERSVVIAYDVIGGEFTGIGSQIQLTAVPTGYEDPSYQWQYYDGSSWKNIDGETSPVYMINVTEENSSYRWRVNVEENSQVDSRIQS